MEPLIKFRSSIDKLNDKEFQIFTNKWISLLNRDIITSSIFNYFLNRKPPHNHYNLNIIMDSINGIINKRKKQSTTENSLTCKKLDELPSALIGAISSFLYQTDVANFEQTNRKTYISCNNPSQLTTASAMAQMLQCDIRNKYSLLKTFAFGIKELTIYMEKYTQNIKFTRLNELAIWCINYDTQNTIDNFLKSNNLINFENIKSLNLCNPSPTHMNVLDIGALYKFLALFTNLERFRINFIHFGDNADFLDNILNKLFPKLKFFHVNNSSNPMLVNKIINLRCRQLETLSLLDRYELTINPACDFGKLKDLCLSSPSLELMNGILNSNNTLQRLAIRSFDPWNVKCNDLENIILKLITSKKSLEYIGFDVYIEELKKYTDIITNVLILCQLKDIKKKDFQIQYKAYYRGVSPVIDVNFISLMIGNMVNKLEKLTSKNFVLEFNFQSAPGQILLINEQSKDTMMKVFNESYMCREKINKTKTEQLFTISNKDCTVCSFMNRMLQWTV